MDGTSLVYRIWKNLPVCYAEALSCEVRLVQGYNDMLGELHV